MCSRLLPSVVLYMGFLTSQSLQAQDYGRLEYVATLPKFLEENSGLAMLSGNSQLYVVNDSGGKNAIYGVDQQSGNIQQEIRLTNATNVDWEDLASDGKTLYVGDFGNNGNYRKDLKIYWVSELQTRTERYIEKEAKITSFYFEDQEDFPPKKSKLNFDVEAFIVHNENFYLFTRNRSKGFDGTVKLYCVPMREGHHKASLIDTFKTCDTKENCQITAATIHQETGTVALLSANKVWLLTEYSGNFFFKGKVEKIKLKHHSQKEAIYFKDVSTLYISEEKSKKSKGNLYFLDITED